MVLVRLLYRNLKQYQWLVLLAIFVTIGQVICNLIAAMPLKFITSKVNNPGADPSCNFPFLGPVLSLFDSPILDPSLRPTGPNQPVGTPPPAPCPANPANPDSIIHPMITQHSVIGVIVFSLLVLIVFSALSALLAYLEMSLAAYISQQVSANLRAQLFDHLQRLSLDWHDRQKKGDLVQRITGNIADIEKLVNDGLIDLLAGTLTLVGVAVCMLFISIQYTILSLLITPLLFLLVFTYTGGIKQASRRKAKATGKIADVATEDLNALTVIRAFTLEERERGRFGGYVDNDRAAGLRAGYLQAQFAPLVSIVVAIGTLLVVGVGGYIAAGNSFNLGIFTLQASTIDVGTLILFLTYLSMLYQPMRDLSKLTVVTSNAASGAERIQEVLDQAPEIIETRVAYDGPQRLRGEISFEHVFFGYLQERFVLKDINLSIAAGRKVALVGYSGSGKTTLAKLIPRFYELGQGSLKIDGRDIRDYPLPLLRQNISLVLQDSVLFEGTVRENIAIGRPGATLEQVMEAASKANIHEVIMRMPEGYDTLVREQGSNFSAGQRQRLAIARAILRDTPILILDEPTANLDVEAEAEVMHALNTLMSGRTVLTISHRLSTLGNVDEIIVLSEGRIAERGSFRYLKHLGGVFSRLLEEQNRYNLEREEDEAPVVRSAYLPALHRTAPTPVLSNAMPASAAPVMPVIKAESEEEEHSFTSEITAMTPTVSASVTAEMTHKVPVSLPTVSSERHGHDVGSIPHPKLVVTAKKRQPVNAFVQIQRDGKVQGVYRLQAPMMRIGRKSHCEIQIASPRISRTHAILKWQDGAWMIEDADSLNGLIWQGYSINRMALTNGDRIYLDPTIILHYIEEPEQSTRPLQDAKELSSDREAPRDMDTKAPESVSNAAYDGSLSVVRPVNPLRAGRGFAPPRRPNGIPRA